jgi:hypothetical protein
LRYLVDGVGDAPAGARRRSALSVGLRRELYIGVVGLVMGCIGVVDTTFARVDMGGVAVEELRQLDARRRG